MGKYDRSPIGTDIRIRYPVSGKKSNIGPRFICVGLFVDNRMQVVKSGKPHRGSYLLRRSRCSSGDVIADAVTSRFPASEMLSVETISGKLHFYND